MPKDPRSPLEACIIHLGGGAPAYLEDCIAQFFAFNADRRLYLVAPRDQSDAGLAARHPGLVVVATEDLKPSRAHRFFSRWNRMDQAFRGGFWRFAIERFFYLEDLMRSRGLDRVLHFEYDNLLYFSLGELEEAFESTSSGLSLPMDAPRRCILSVLYVARVEALRDFCRAYVLRYLVRGLNDMKAFSRYAKSRTLTFLPVIPTSYAAGRTELANRIGERTRKMEPFFENFEAFGGVFDAAALGQYVGGIDPRNDPESGPGFVNEMAMYDPRDFNIRWERDGAERWVPVGEIGGQRFRIFNLHIHSKRLDLYRSDRERIAE